MERAHLDATRHLGRHAGKVGKPLQLSLIKTSGTTCGVWLWKKRLAIIGQVTRALVKSREHWPRKQQAPIAFTLSQLYDIEQVQIQSECAFPRHRNGPHRPGACTRGEFTRGIQPRTHPSIRRRQMVVSCSICVFVNKCASALFIGLF